MQSGASETLCTLTNEIRSKRRATLSTTGTLGFPQDYDEIMSHLPLILPSVLGGPQKYVYAYPARIIAGAPEVAREHAGLALCNAITLASDRGEAMVKIVIELANKAFYGTTLETTVLAEVLEETYEQLSNRMSVGRARGDLGSLEGVPDQFRRVVVEAIEEFLLEEWQATFGTPILLKKLINISSLYAYLHSRGIVQTHDFLNTLTHILEEYTAESLDLLMIAVIYLMSRGTMTEARRAIPLEFWVMAQEQLNGIEGKTRQNFRHLDELMEEDTVELLCGQAPTGTHFIRETGHKSDEFFSTLSTLNESFPDFTRGSNSTPTSSTSHLFFDDAYQASTKALCAFIEEFIVADTHAALFRHDYPCGFVEFCAEPSPKYARTFPTPEYTKKWFYLNKLCSRIARWANVKGIETEMNWGIILDMDYQDSEFEEDYGDEGVDVESLSEDEETQNEELDDARNGQDGIVESHCLPSPGFAPIGFEPITWAFKSQVNLASTSNPLIPIWMRRGLDKPRFLEWRPRLAESTFPYPTAYRSTKPVNAVEANGWAESTETLAEVQRTSDGPGPFLVRLSDLTSISSTTGSHDLLPPVDPRITNPNREFKNKMNNCNMIWTLGPSGAYKASLVARAEKGDVRPQNWVLRQDDLLSPCSCR